jgi:hypothetical protein
MTIMYVCDTCKNDCPEACGHFDRNEVRVMSDGSWICENCFDELAIADVIAAGGGDLKPLWSRLPAAPEYVPQVADQE